MYSVINYATVRGRKSFEFGSRVINQALDHWSTVRAEYRAFYLHTFPQVLTVTGTD